MNLERIEDKLDEIASSLYDIENTLGNLLWVYGQINGFDIETTNGDVTKFQIIKDSHMASEVKIK